MRHAIDITHLSIGIGIALGTLLPIQAQATSLPSPLRLENLEDRPALEKTVMRPRALADASLHLPKVRESRLVSRLVLKLSERRLYAYQGDREVAQYPVAVGRNDWETPTGEFTVLQRQPDPAWEHPFTGTVVPPGPDNPLGARWIGFWTDGVNAIGFHGTPDEHLIGQAVSHGCVRMRNADVIDLYNRVAIGTPVIVLP
jgi:hypothetical protein